MKPNEELKNFFVTKRAVEYGCVPANTIIRVSPYVSEKITDDMLASSKNKGGRKTILGNYLRQTEYGMDLRSVAAEAHQLRRATEEEMNTYNEMHAKFIAEREAEEEKRKREWKELCEREERERKEREQAREAEKKTFAYKAKHAKMWVLRKLTFAAGELSAYVRGKYDDCSYGDREERDIFFKELEELMRKESDSGHRRKCRCPYINWNWWK
jgi:hypothetical protein